MERLQPLRRHLGLPHVEVLQPLAVLEVRQPRIAHLRAAQREETKKTDEKEGEDYSVIDNYFT